MDTDKTDTRELFCFTCRVTAEKSVLLQEPAAMSWSRLQRSGCPCCTAGAGQGLVWKEGERIPSARLGRS